MYNSVSIILPIYNMELYLKDALESVLKQSLKSIEIICVNDGSTDNSLSILQEYAKLDSRIKIINQKNSGSGIARNNGIFVANGEYIAFLDPDDFLYNDSALENLYKNAKINDCDMAGGNFEFICSQQNDTNEKKSIEILEEEKKYKETTNYCFQTDFVGKTEDYKMSGWFWRFIFKKEFLDKNNIIFPSYTRFQDIPFLAKSLSLCDKIYFSKENYYCYRINHKIINYSKQQMFDIISALSDCFDIYYNNKKFIQYSDTFTIFIEMLNVFSDNFVSNPSEYGNFIKFSNDVFEKIDFSLFDFSFFSKKNVRNLVNILYEKNYLKLLSLPCDYYEDTFFENLNADYKELFNLKAFHFIQSFMKHYKINQIYFNGGAILNQNKLKSRFEIDDWDIHLIDGEKNIDEIYESVKRNPMSIGLIERGSTASTQKSIVFEYQREKIDFQVKKARYRPENHCTFDIDSLCTANHIDNMNFLIQNPYSLNSLKTQTTQLRAKQSDIYRILRRLVILVAKYDIKKFQLDENTIIDMEKDNTEIIEQLKNQNSRNGVVILEKSDKVKASVLTKFFCMCYRVKNLFEYVMKINKSNIFDRVFPYLSQAIKNNDFLESLKIESSLPEERRTINNTNDFVGLLMSFNKNNIELARELLILKESAFNEVNIKTIELISKGNNITTKAMGNL